MIRVLAASLHLLALGLGLGAVLTRGNVLREPITSESLKRAFRADNLWAVAAALWLATGLWRVFGGLEKTPGYYAINHWFITKMVLFGVIVALEVLPIVVLIRWRMVLRRGESPATFAPVPVARRIAMLSHVQALLVVLMIFAACAMARGFGLPA
jgi:putative membrane protein